MVRTVVRLPDGDHAVRELLVCDPFKIALWSTEYMGHFGFAAVLESADAVSYVRTPTGCQVPLSHRPYGLVAPCRAPTSGETEDDLRRGREALSSCAPPASSHGARSAALSARSGQPLRLVSTKEAWRLHYSTMHSGWESLARTFGLRFPPMPPCPVCRLTRSRRVHHASHDIVATAPGQLTHSDTWGPFAEAIYYVGCRYVVAFKDDYSRVLLFVFCKDRTSSTLLEAYKVYAAFMRSYGVELSGTWMSDNGPEYVSHEAYDFCDDHALQRLLAVRYTPQQNGGAESAFGVHVPRTRAGLKGGNLPKRGYALGMQYSAWLSNRTISKRLGCRPLDRLPHPPRDDIHHCHPLGCRVWAHQPDVDRPDKMSDTSRAGVFFGVSELYKGVIVWYPDTNEFEAAINVDWADDEYPLVDAAPPPRPPQPLPLPSPLPQMHVQERVRAPVIPRIPPPEHSDLQLLGPRPAGTPLAAPRAGDPGTGARPPPPPPRRPHPPQRLFANMAPPPPAVRPEVGMLNRPIGLYPPPLLPTRRPGSRAGTADRQASLACVFAWLAATALPSARLSPPPDDDGRPVVAIIFAGGPDVDGTTLLERVLLARGARPLAVDVLIGGRAHDLLNTAPDGIGWHLLRYASQGGIHSLHAAVPCETFSVALDDVDMVRSASSPMGLPGLAPHLAARLFASNCLVQFTLDLARAVAASGGEVTIENPVPRCDVSLPHVYWGAKAHHANLFRTKPVQDYRAETRSVELVTPLCAFGLDMQKYVMMLATPHVGLRLAPVGEIVCAHPEHAERAYGSTADGSPAALLSGRYPYAFCVTLACAHLGLPLPGVDSSGVSPLVVAPQDPVDRVVRAPSDSSSAVLANRCHVSSWTWYAAPDAFSVVCPGGSSVAVLSCSVGATREQVVRAPGYEAPSGPGWWDDVDEGDLSDDGDDVFAVTSGSVVQAYRSCVKVESSALKAAVRTRFSEGPDGNTVRHDIPRGYDEASVHPDCARIWEAMIREHDAHIDCGTWDLRPESECYESGKFPIDCMWVYDCKVDSTTQLFLLWKARLVARGDQMVYLRDYTTTYSGVVRHGTWRLFLAVCAMSGLELTGADVSTAYLHAPLRDHVVWMRQPKGFEQRLDGKPALCRLRMAIYGLKQSAREWAITVVAWLVKWGFRQCVSDRYLFVHTAAGADDGPARKLILLIWVDDIFLGHSCGELRGSFMRAFKARFRVKDLGPLRQGLGASIMQSVSEGWVSFSLEKYISDLARRFDLHENVAWADIPLPVAAAKECVLARPPDSEVAASVDEYGVLTGSIVFIATFSRPDVAFAAHFLAKFLVRPGYVHVRLARRVLGYLSRTRSLAITYRRGGDMAMSFSPLDDGKPDLTGKPHMLADTDHGVERSVTGWLFMYAGAAASWAVRGQMLPSLSSTESELYGLSTGVCDLLVCVQVLEEMTVFFTAPLSLLTDSRGARLLHLDEASSARTRHVHRRWYFVRHHIDQGRITVSLVKGSLNHANFLTKPVGGASFNADRAYSLGIREQ